MRNGILLGALLVVAAPAGAQQLWHPEIGVQGGFVRIQASGTGASPADVFEFPTMGYLIPLISYAPVFVTIPVTDRVALEPTVSFAQVSSAGDVTTVRVGLRGNYAFTPHLYAGLGGVVNYASSGSDQFQLGAQIGAGYRFGLGPRLDGRVEADWISTRPGFTLGARNAYALLFGMSARLDGPAASPPARSVSERAWQPMLGFVGGYSNAHVVGGGSITGVVLPGFGGSLSTLGGGGTPPQPPTLFAIFPIGKRLALEPGLDLHRIQGNGQTVFGANMGARLDLAVHSGWYAAVGGQLIYLQATKGTFTDPNRGNATVTGATLAWGYRFHVAGQVNGRTELNYSLYSKSSDIPSPPVNVTSVLFAFMMPLK